MPKKILDFSKKSTVHEAAVRIERHINKYNDYLDRDRDILLLHILYLLEKR